MIPVMLALKDLKVRLVRKVRPDRRAPRVIQVTRGLLFPRDLTMLATFLGAMIKA